MTPSELTRVLELHRLWRRGDPNGSRADLTDANLAGADLTGAYLARADLAGADLKNCYASRLQPRFRMPQYAEQRGSDVTHYLDEKALRSVLTRRKPTKFFWCDMTDMFGPWVPNEWIAACFGVMAATPQHTHQVLTKRSKRMREWFAWVSSDRGFHQVQAGKLHVALCDAMQAAGDWDPNDAICEELLSNANEWPLSNVWLGVSAEDQQRADERIPDLLATPAAVRFVSAEPLLGPVLLDDYLRRGLHWVIVGGESGQSARASDLASIASIVAQCRAAGCACFVKQLGRVCVEDIVLDHYPDGTPRMARSPLPLVDLKGGDPSEWPEPLRVRQWPDAVRI